MADRELPEHARRNRTAWNGYAAQYAEAGRSRWAATEPVWGIFDAPEAELGLLKEGVAGLDSVELGCGTAYVSAWLARRGARPVGIDNSPAQPTTARALQAEFRIHFPLHLGNAEATAFADASFDLAISEYGASIWCDPYAWIPEAARLLRPGGRLVFLLNSTLQMLCTADDDPEAPVDDRLRRDFFGMHRFELEGPTGSVEFHLGHGDWIRLLRGHGFEVEDLLEVRPPAEATTRYPYVAVEWARRWPAEEVWKARKR